MLAVLVGSVVAIATGWLVAVFELGWDTSNGVAGSVLEWGFDNGPAVVVAARLPLLGSWPSPGWRSSPSLG